MLLLNILAPLLGLVMIAKAFSRFRRGEKTWRELVLWVVIWGVFAFVGLWPSSVEGLSGFLGIKSGLNVIIFSSIAVLFFIVFHLILACEVLEMRLTSVVRDIALKDPQCLDQSKR